MTEELNTGCIGANSTLPHFASEAYGQSSTMAASLIEDRCADATMPHINMYRNSFVMGAQYIGGGYTNLLRGVDQAAALQPPARKLNFDGVPNEENL
jgi:hypothetical protein